MEPHTEVERQIQITGDFDRTAAEALALKIRRLARECGVELAGLDIVPERKDLKPGSSGERG